MPLSWQFYVQLYILFALTQHSQKSLSDVLCTKADKAGSTAPLLMLHFLSWVFLGCSPGNWSSDQEGSGERSWGRHHCLIKHFFYLRLPYYFQGKGIRKSIFQQRTILRRLKDTYQFKILLCTYIGTHLKSQHTLSLTLIWFSVKNPNFIRCIQDIARVIIVLTVAPSTWL
jgi:hypothetical protein